MVSTSGVIAKALVAIKKVGLLVTFTVKSDGTYSPTTGSRTGVQTATHLLWSSPPVEYSAFYKSPESSAKIGISIIVVPYQTADFIPAPGITVDIGGEIWLVEGVKPAQFKTTVVAWTLELTRG